MQILVFIVLTTLLFSQAVAAKQAAIASAHPLATQAGIEILAAGGNAFDAAIAVSAALAVVEPHGSGLGGGGFYLLHQAEQKKNTMLDARETAPLAARVDMYSKGGIANTAASRLGALAAGIPGIPAALDRLAKQYGRLPLQQSLEPAIALARQGFAITPRYIKMATYAKNKLSLAAQDTFFPNGELVEGQQLIQKDLAATLQLLADQGRAGFYNGKFAQQLVQAVNDAGGIWSEQDLATYQVIEREPISIRYQGTQITTAALPSSGGIVLTQMLHMLENYALEDMDGVQQVHLLTEIMRRAYHQRAVYLGDSDFVEVLLERLLNRYYADGLAASIRMDKATPSDMFASVTATSPAKGQDTSHFSIIDKDGNRVAATLSVNFPFGSGFMPSGSGVILNNQMDDFSMLPGVANGYGLVGNAANAIAGGKRMLSSMTPTFIEDEGRIAVIGTPGGSRIISMVMFAILKFAKGDSAEEIVSMLRFHHQYLPDVIQYEKGRLTRAMRLELQILGHRLQELEHYYGNMQLLIYNKNEQTVEAASDSRGEGLAIIK